MKQSAVEQLAIAFRQWQKDWSNFEETKKYKPQPFDKFIESFLELEKQQIIDAYRKGKIQQLENSELYYNETFKKNKI